MSILKRYTGSAWEIVAPSKGEFDTLSTNFTNHTTKAAGAGDLGHITSNGNYPNLRAGATTKGDVGLGNVDNVKQSPDGHNIAHHSDATGTTASRTSSSTTLLLQAKGMNDHRTSATDHDGNYVKGSYTIQKNGTDGAGIINFKT